MINRQYLSAFVLGALSVTGFAPFGFFPLPILSLALLFLLWRQLSPRRALWSGYFYGLGLMLFGVFWLHISISQFGGVSLPLAMLLAVIFAFVMALFYAAAGYLARRIVLYFHLTDMPAFLLVLPAVWVLMEIARGYFLGGFPWLVMGYSQIDSPLAQLAPVGGVYAVSWLVLLSAGLLGLLVAGQRPARLAALTLLLLVGAGLAALSGLRWNVPDGHPMSVRLVQGNIAQEEKWQPANLLSTVDLYTRLSFAEPAELIIWPETAVPAFYHRVEDSLIPLLQDRLAENDAALVLGIPFWSDQDSRYFNSMISLGKSSDRYDKRHLVPFGEFMPLDFVLRPVLDFLHIPMSDFAAGQAERPLLQVGGQPVGVSICYEDAFGDESIQALPAARYLINISNDAWFGDSLAPYQHLEIARMRALESGRYLLRATNTGISAIIDEKGRILAQSGQGEQAVLSGQVQPMQGATLYVRQGDWLVLVFMFLILVAVSFAGRRSAQ